MKNYTSHRRLEDTQLMVLSKSADELQFAKVGELSAHLNPRDLLVMNSSATLPASFYLESGLELRLAAFAGPDPLKDLREWWAVIFGSGDWQQPTERRGPAPLLRVGRLLPLNIKVLEVNPRHPRLVRVRFEAPNYLQQIYQKGKPIQYSYHRDELKLWDIQTLLSGFPLSVEPPSSLMPLSWRQLLPLKTQTAFLLHGAGLSSTGDTKLDQLLPLPEYYSVPEETMRRVEQARARGGRVIAVGTTVARALESVARLGRLQGYTDLRLGPQNPVQVIDGLLTGYHEPETSHFQLEAALTSTSRLMDSYARAEQRGFMGHEFGDAVLIA